jgi:heterogeneous nuclear ribonucleoprotein U-like protein 1
MKVAELREELGRRGLETTGVKADLVERLTAAMEATSQPAAKKAKMGAKAAVAATDDDEEERPAKKAKAPPKAKAKSAAAKKGMQ